MLQVWEPVTFTCRSCGKRIRTIRSRGDVLDPMDLLMRKDNDCCPECRKRLHAKRNKRTQ